MLFAAVFIAHFVGHHIADYLLQTDDISKNKVCGSERTDGERAAHDGWDHNLRHGLHHALAGGLLVPLVLAHVGGLNALFMVLQPGYLLGWVFIVGSHMFIDRRFPVRWLLNHTGSTEFAKMTTPIFGMFVADQALHFICMFIGALIQTSPLLTL